MTVKFKNEVLLTLDSGKNLHSNALIEVYRHKNRMFNKFSSCFLVSFGIMTVLSRLFDKLAISVPKL
ncbi:MAG: hypothetical protein RLZZ66_156 [Pseudomonadota bacterium]|jgi:hypothetical protein